MSEQSPTVFLVGAEEAEPFGITEHYALVAGLRYYVFILGQGI